MHRLSSLLLKRKVSFPSSECLKLPRHYYFRFITQIERVFITQKEREYINRFKICLKILLVTDINMNTLCILPKGQLANSFQSIVSGCFSSSKSKFLPANLVYQKANGNLSVCVFPEVRCKDWCQKLKKKGFSNYSYHLGRNT